MTTKTRLPNRRSLRKKGYDYQSVGAYFVTLCTKPWIPLFGNIVNGRMILNRCGRIAEECMIETPSHFPGVHMDEFVIMPDHVHALIFIKEPRGDLKKRLSTKVSTPAWPNGPPPRSLGAIVGSYKSAVSKRINRLQKTPGAKIWLRNYHESIVWNQASIERVRRYIRNNPKKAWEKKRGERLRL